MQIEKLINVASEVRIATLKLKEQGIYSYNDAFDTFHIPEDMFLSILGDKKYKVTLRNCTEYPHRYAVTITGLTFYCITNKLLFEGDEKKIKESE